MTAKKHQARPTVDWAELQEKPWQIWAIRWVSIAALATCLIADNGSPTVSSLCKVAFLQPLIAIVVALWIPLAVADKRYRPNWRHPLVLGVLGFGVALVLTLITSVDPHRSFWSSIFRLAGVFNYWHFILWFLALASTHRTWRDWRPLLAAANWIGMIVAFVGFYRYLNGGAAVPRLVSTIDNALYVAAFLLLQLFIALMLRRAATNAFGKAWYTFCIGVFALALFMTGSRSATASAALGLGLLAAYSLLANPAKRFRGGAVLVGLGLAGLGLIIFLRSPAGASVANHLPVFANRIVMATDFGQDRGSLAAIAWDAFRARPVLGWGLEHYETAFEKFYQPIGRDYLLAEPWYDRAHNQFAEFLATGGLILFLAYVAFWIVLFYVTVRRLRQRSADGIDAALLACFIAYAAAMLFSFDMPGPMTVQWLLIALIGGLTMTPPTPTTKAPTASLGVTTLLVVAVLIAEGFWSIKPYMQAVAMETDCRDLFSYTDSAIADAQRILKDRNFATPELEFRFMSCSDSVKSYEQTTDEQGRKISKAVAEVMDEAYKQRPYDYKTALATGYALLKDGRYEPAALNQAETVLRHAAELSPRRYRTPEQLAELAIMRRDFAKAADLMQEAYEKTDYVSERVRLELRAAWAAAMANEPLRAAMYINLASHEPGGDVTVDGNALAVLQRSWPSGRALPPEVIAYANAVADKLGSAEALQARYRLFVLAGAPTDLQVAALEALRAKFPDLADIASQPMP
jgi:O-antigen ligase